VEHAWQKERILHRAMKLWIPEDRLSHHMLLVGRTGTRKSSIIRGFVDQAIARGWPCVFIDPKREYWEEYGDPERDNLIDLLDTRSVTWHPGEEAEDEVRGIGAMAAAYPDGKDKHSFFQSYSRAIMGFLIGVYHPSAAELAAWLMDRKEVIDRVKGSEYAQILSGKDSALVESIFANINQFGRLLRWMPTDGKPFSVREWGEMGKNRTGHIFLCSTPDTREALKPLHCMIMDLALIALQKHGAPGFVVADEFPLLGRIPQLGDAMRLMRSAGCPILLAAQDFPAIADVYGERQAESIVSNAYSQIVLGQNEPHTAEFSSKLLGLPSQIEREQLKNGQKQDPAFRSAVTGGDIMALEDGAGFLKQGGYMTPIQVKWRPSSPRIPKLIERSLYRPPNELTEKKSRYAA
jgi:hypothetical protein